MIHAGHFRIPADHPCLPGHFPGSPVVPGVVLLDNLLALLGLTSAGAVLPEVKFLRPVRPEQAVEVYYERRETLVRFEARVDGAAVLKGRILPGDPACAQR